MTANYSEDEHDLLRETFNLAVGQAGAQLAELLHAFVDLTVPEIQIVAAEKMLEALVADPSLASQQHLSAVRQTFYRGDQVDGEAVVLFANAPDTISRVLGVDGAAGRAQEMEVLLELSNIVVGACLNGIALQLFSAEMSFGPPSVLADNTDIRKLVCELFPRRALKWNQCLLGRIRFKMETDSFSAELLVFMSERSIQAVRESLQARLAQL